MNRNVYFLSALALGFSAFFAAPRTAHAEDFSLHLEPGIIQPLNNPQADIYQTGMVLGAKGMFNLKPWLTLGPSVSAAYFPKVTDDGSNAGVLWQFGGSLRAQRSHSIFNDDGNWSPWVDVDLMAGHTGNLWRPTFDVGVGIDAALDQNHSAWIGPFLRYTQVLQTSYHQDGAALDRSNPALLQAGLSVSFDFPTRTKVSVVRTHDVEVRTVHVVEHDHAAVVQATPAPEKFELTEHVYFDFDKAVLRWESRDKLDAVVRKLNEHPQVNLLVKGHASSDGQLSHNQELAQRRTIAVVDYLISHGVSASRLQGEGFGVNYPAAPNTTQEGRERNRRVEFTVTFTSK